MYHEQASPVRNGYVCVCMYAQGTGRVVGGELVVDHGRICSGHLVTEQQDGDQCGKYGALGIGIWVGCGL